jgi:nickel/cobalt transporter (NiCoT) family protein
LTHFFHLAAASNPLSVRARAVVMMIALAAANALVWLGVWVAFDGRPALVGTAMLAYGLGLRHAVDADHIAAIDNATRKMMESGRRPVTLGMFFSLGHSAVVFALTFAVAATTATFASLIEPVRAFASVVGTGLSLLFLVAIAAANVMTLVSLVRALLRERAGGERGGGEHGGHVHEMAAGGLMARLLAPLTRCVTRGWHMLFVGFLFGLSFETASEIGLLGLSASEMMNGLSPWLILAFPALFAAGMSLLDAADGAMMIGVYGWALSRPKRRLVYNIIITALSVFVALLIAGIGVAGLLARHDDKTGGALPAGLSDVDMNTLGYVVVFVFAAAWLIAVTVSRWRAQPPARETAARAAPARRPQRRIAWINARAAKMTTNDTPVVTVPSA